MMRYAAANASYKICDRTQKIDTFPYEEETGIQT